MKAPAVSGFVTFYDGISGGESEIRKRAAGCGHPDSRGAVGRFPDGGAGLPGQEILRIRHRPKARQKIRKSAAFPV
jgi:hypothetical protein